MATSLAELLKSTTAIVSEVVNESKSCTTATDNLLRVLESQSHEFENTFATATPDVRAQLFALLLAASKSTALPASELLSIASINQTHEALRHTPAVSIVVEALALVAADTALPMTIRSSASRSMLSVAVPSAYFQEEGKCNIDGQTHDDHNAIPIDRLTKVYSQAINATITAVVDLHLLRKISASLALENALKHGSGPAQMADTTMEFTRILLQNSTQNYAILRRHLSKDCPEFVPGTVLPRLKGILKHAQQLTGLSQNNGAANRRLWLSVQKPLATVLCLMALLTFKVKAMRGMIASSNVCETILEFKSLSSHPHVLAVLIKLHVNIEGGYGNAWRAQHKRVVQKIRTRLEELACVPSTMNVVDQKMNSKQSLRVQAFHQALHAYTIPFNRKSRAYADLAYAWRIQYLCRPGEVLGAFHAGGRGYVGETNDGGGAGGDGFKIPTPALQSLAKENTNASMVEAAFFPRPQNTSASYVNMGGSSKTKETTPNETTPNETTTPNEIKPTSLSLDSKKINTPTELEGKYELEGKHCEKNIHETTDTDTASHQCRTVEGYPSKSYSSYNTVPPKEAARIMQPDRMDKGMELDELDGILLGLDRGPPPKRFLCGLTSNVMSDPLQHPRHEHVWVDREALENYHEQALVALVDSEREKNQIRWPGAGDLEPFLPDDLSQIATDVLLQHDINQWQVRKGVF